MAIRCGAFVVLLLGLLCRAWSADAPYYSKYVFDGSARTIEFGPIVTAVPNAVVGEILRRDMILREMLGATGFGYHPLDSGNDALKLFVEGKINATITSDVSMMEIGVRTEIVNIGLYKENFGAVVGPRGQTLAGLKGRRVATPGAGAGHFTLLRALDQAGLKESDITLVTMNVREMPKALAEGRIEAFSAFEPTPSTVLGKHGNRYAILYRHRAPGYMLVTRALKEANPAAVRNLAAGLARAVNWLRKDRRNLERASLWASQAMRAFDAPALTEREIVRMTRSDLLEIREAPAMPAADADDNSLPARNFAFLTQRDRIAGGIGWDRIKHSFDYSVMSEVLANPRQHRINEFNYDLH